MQQVEVVQFGDGLGIVLPDAVIKHFGLQDGDTLTLVNDGDSIMVRKFTSDEQRALVTAHKVMERYRNALTELAKGPE